MTLQAFIDAALNGTTGLALYTAYRDTCETLQNTSGQILDARAQAVFDVLKPALMFGRPLTQDERSILEGLRPA